MADPSPNPGLSNHITTSLFYCGVPTKYLFNPNPGGYIKNVLPEG